MIVRYLSAAGLGLAVTAALLWSMHYLIELTDTGHEPRVVPTFDWFKTVRKDSELTTTEPKPKRISPVLPPPALRTATERGESFSFTAIPTGPVAPTRKTFRPTMLGPADSALVTMVQPQPEYPINARQRGIEGYADVVFDVTAYGTVVNARAVASSHRLFENAAIRAAERTRFRPRMVDGMPQPTAGLRKRYRFEMKN